jgi:hypothetical protein
MGKLEVELDPKLQLTVHVHDPPTASEEASAAQAQEHRCLPVMLRMQRKPVGAIGEYAGNGRPALDDRRG